MIRASLAMGPALPRSARHCPALTGGAMTGRHIRHQNARNGSARGRATALPCAMRHTFVWVRVHLAWSTYRREPWIEPAWQERLYRCLARVARRKGTIALAIGGAGDHIHVYVSLSARTPVASLVDALKANSYRWIHDRFPQLDVFAWQKGYSAFSV